MNDQSIKNHSESVRRSYRPEARQTSRKNKQEDSYLENCKKERNKIFKYKSKAWESSPPNTTVSSSDDETSLKSVRKKSAKKCLVKIENTERILQNIKEKIKFQKERSLKKYIKLNVESLNKS